ncbi:xylulokinase [Corynebacterium imitans]|uniref:xylulokinase n=1 Tax=Corynebacterium imitans TaxID=156978 RepID=UPI0025511A01|nr:xylulokinase [Corynebacterium imitans]MDK8305453.1 xylulokinase [Corynebacterium imitans]MDK8636246.1 xylulokinase [Corynebacterium imitans]MDK8771444.1 xylulokinase [Corynebacterium imitans]
MSLVLGIDSSTQSTKALLVDASSGAILDQRRAAHPTGTQVDPTAWLDAMQEATAELLPRAEAVAVGGQQHGMITLDSNDQVVRNAMLWNDTSSAPQALELIDELGGAEASAEKLGSVLVASFTGTKLRWMRDNEPENAKRTASVLLPHDYLTWHLGGREQMTTDHGDASGTGYYSTRDRVFLPELAEQYLGSAVTLPRIAEPSEIVGTTAHGAKIAAGTGDNMAAALGMNLQPGDVCVSIGTSGVASAVSTKSVHDASGGVTGFCDATGNYLPLACTLNGAKVLDFAANMLGVNHQQLAELALAGTPGANGVTLLPYLDGERTPNRPNAKGQFYGITTTTSREDIARAVVEGLLCSMRDAIEALQRATGVATERVLLIGGGAKSEAVQKIAPTIFGVPVVVPDSSEFVALGAARQAAWALSGETTPPEWQLGNLHTYDGEECAGAVGRYKVLRDFVEGFEERVHDR